MNITVADIKKYLNISTSTQDTQIGNLIKPVADLLFAKCNNWFEAAEDQIFINDLGIDFYNTDPAVIECNDSVVYAGGFRDGMDIRIKGSAFNDGIYSVDVADDTAFVLVDGETLIEEMNYTANSNRVISITPVYIPEGFKMVLAKFIGEDLKYVANSDRVNSERVGNTSFNYGSHNYGEYPDGLMKLLKPFKRPSYA